MRHAVRTAFVSFGLLAVALLFAVGLGEVVLRAFFPQNVEPHPPGLYTLDPELGFILTPNATGTLHSPEFAVDVRVNSMGLRERELGAKQPGETRILVLGDSFTFGTGVDAEDAWPRQVEKHLNTSDGRGITVVNAGVPQYGTRQEAMWFARIADRVDPDAVLVGVFLGNDFLDNVEQTKYEIIGGYLAAESYDKNWVSLTERLGIPPEVKVWLRTHSHVYALLMNAWMRFTAVMGWTDTETMLQIYREEPTDQTREAITAMRESLALLKQYCEDRDLALGVVIIPDGRVVNVLDQREGYRANIPAELLRGIAEEERLPVLDLGDRFQRNAALYYPVDGHWNTLGNELAGATVGASLLQGELAPVLQNSAAGVQTHGEG